MNNKDYIDTARCLIEDIREKTYEEQRALRNMIRCCESYYSENTTSKDYEKIRFELTIREQQNEILKLDEKMKEKIKIVIEMAIDSLKEKSNNKKIINNDKKETLKEIFERDYNFLVNSDNHKEKQKIKTSTLKPRTNKERTSNRYKLKLKPSFARFN